MLNYFIFGVLIVVIVYLSIYFIRRIGRNEKDEPMDTPYLHGDDI
jgi:hypothetical protein